MLASCSGEGTKVQDDSKALTAPHLVVAPGTNLRTITGGGAACGINTGIAFDGTNLIISCWFRSSLDYVDVTTGALVKTVNLTCSGCTFGSLGAMAWDQSRGKIWICSEPNVDLIDPVTGIATQQFSTPGCIDGLAFDGSDGTLYTSPDANANVSHWSNTGTLLGTTNVGANLGGPGNSGIAVGGAKLYLANNGGQQIYEVAKDFSTYALFASFPQRLEDLECDDVTFASQGTGAIWVIDAFDRTLNAYAIPQGACNFGGGGGGSHGPLTTYPGQAFPGHVVLCKNVSSPPGHYTYTISATQGTVAGDVVQPTATLSPGQCRVIFQRPNPSATLVHLSITETPVAGTGVGSITRQELGGGPQVLPGPSANTIVRANSTFGAVVTYNNQHGGS
jgi:hypothetical protein